MDEFNDIDDEIARFKQEFTSRDGEQQSFRSPAGSDYWQRRLDEERMTWKKKMDLREDERKALESKLNEQQAKISGYDKVLRDLEKRLEGESIQWEERLRAKETDILIEKNRLLSEEKVRNAETRNRELLEQLGGLNAKIAALKEDLAEAAKSREEEMIRQKSAYEDRARAAAKQAELLEGRARELASALDLKAGEIEKLKLELDGKTEEARLNLGNSEKEKSALREEAAAFQAKAANEKAGLRKTYEDASSEFARTVRRFIGPMTGLIRFISKHEVDNSTRSVFNELIQKIDNETELFALQLSLPQGAGEPFRAALCVPDPDVAFWQSALSGTQAEIKTVSPRDPVAAVRAIKPRVAILSGAFAGEAAKLRAAVPFLPILVSGDVQPGAAQKLAAKDFRVLPFPATNEEIGRAVTAEALSSIALPEYWDTIKVRHSYFKTAALAALVVASLAGGFLLRYASLPMPFFNTAGITTPYDRPTNITYDGQYLWTCDWLGQSIYKHEATGSLKLVRIYCQPGKRFSALAWSGGYLWSADPWEKRIYKHGGDENLSVVSSFPSPGTSPSGLASGDRVLWSCDADTGMIYQHKMDDKLTVELAVPSPGTSPSGLYFDGEYLWSSDSKTSRVYRHRLDAGLTVLNAYAVPDRGEKGFNVGGLARAGNELWVSSEKAGKISGYALASLKEVQ